MGNITQYDVVIVGAGAAGLMCAAEAGARGRRVLVIDKAKKPAEKVRISGGGRCNFTNLHTTPQNFISQNPHFCVSALKRFTPQDFINKVELAGIAYHEKTLGQLFCDDSSQNIINMLLRLCEDAKVTIRLNTLVGKIERVDKEKFSVEIGNDEHVQCQSLVIATGGLSIPKMGATDLGYMVARQFGLKVVSPSAGLVPFIQEGEWLKRFRALAGVSVDKVTVTCGGAKFTEAMLFTHRGLSGPVILQISSYWQKDQVVTINLMPGSDVGDLLLKAKSSSPRQDVATFLADILPKRLAQSLCEWSQCTGKLADLSHKKLKMLADAVQRWELIPSGTEGYRTAEVTLGGVDTAELSSKTMESLSVSGLFFIGEVVDVTGHLGGFNFQWAWSSSWAAGQYV